MYLIAALLLTAEASLGGACGADCGAAAAFGKKRSPILFLLFLSFFLTCDLLSAVLSDVGYFFVAQFQSINVPRWYVMRISSRSRIVFMSYF